MIKRIAQTAGFSALLAALLLTLLQSLWVSPLILEAETYESAEPVAEHSHAQGTAAHDHHHDADAWAPQDGLQRTLFTGLSNLVVAVGFALMLAGLYSLHAPGRTWQGLLWGLAGFATFNLAPAIGLPPELPGTAAAELTLRQYWSVLPPAPPLAWHCWRSVGSGGCVFSGCCCCPCPTWSAHRSPKRMKAWHPRR
jgi:cobalt transporter subunit CbtA